MIHALTKHLKLVAKELLDLTIFMIVSYYEIRDYAYRIRFLDLTKRVIDKGSSWRMTHGTLQC